MEFPWQLDADIDMGDNFSYWMLYLKTRIEFEEDDTTLDVEYSAIPTAYALASATVSFSI